MKVSTDKENKKKQYLLLIVTAIVLIILAIVFIFGLRKDHRYEVNTNRIIEATTEYIESQNLVIGEKTMIPLRALAEEDLIHFYIESNCLANSYVVVTRESDGYHYEPVMICDSVENITLSGKEVMTVEAGSTYQEPGATSQDGSNITIIGSPNTSKLGNYFISYENENGEVVIREVKVVDTTKPVIILKGSTTIYLNLNDTFVDPGYTATDNLDGNITDKVVATGNVNTSTPGSYTRTYSVSDASGNETLVTRQVIVRNQTPVIHLKGDSIVYVDAYSSYVEAGYTASDRLDGDLSNEVLVSGSVDTTKPGKYTLTYQVMNSTGVQATVSRTIIVRDTEKPSISFVGEAIIEINYGDTTYQEQGVSAYDRVDGDLSNNVVITSNFDANKLGVYGITYTVTDKAGNVNSITRTVKIVDKTAPIVSLIGENEIKLNANHVYEEQGVSITDNYDKDLKAEITSNVDVTKLGTYEVKYVVTDTSGNTTTVTRSVVVVDEEAPVITIDGEKDITVELGTTYEDAGATVSDNYSQNISLVTEGQVNTNVVGVYEITYRATDEAGNEATPVVRTIRVVDTTKPNITITTDDIDAFVKKPNVSVKVDDLSDLKAVSYAWSTDKDNSGAYQLLSYIKGESVSVDFDLADGTYYLFIKAVDAYDNEVINMIGSISVDTTGAAIVLSPDSYLGENVSIQIKATDLLSGIDTISYAWSSSSSEEPTEYVAYFGEALSLDKDGIYYLWVKAIDKAGNTTSYVSNAYEIDTAKPTIAFEPSDAAAMKELQMKVFISALNGKTIQNISYAWTKDNVEPSLWNEWNLDDYFNDTTLTSDIREDGTYYLWVKATDSHGLVMVSSSKAVTLDTTVPDISLSKESSTVSKEIQVDVTVTEQNSYRVYKAWNQEEAALSATWEEWTDFAINSTFKDSVSTGTYYLHIKVVDEAGNTVVRTAGPYILDNTAPDVPVIQYHEDWTNQPIEITINGDEILLYRIDDGEWLVYDSMNKPMITKNATFAAQAKDEAGNISEAVEVEIKNIDTDKPSIVLDPSEFEITNKYETDFHVTDNASGIDSISYGWGTEKDVKPTFEEYSDFTNGSLSVDGTIVKSDISGTYYLWIKVVDKAGNVETYQTESIHLDVDAPVIGAFPLNEENPVSKQDVDVTITDNDAISSVYYQWSLNANVSDTDHWILWDYDASHILSIENKTGLYYLHVKAVDKAGNETVFTSGTYRVVSNAPVISFDPAPSLSYSNEVSVGVKAESELSNILKLEYAWSKDDTEPTEYVEFENQTQIILNKESGDYYLWVRVTDDVDGTRFNEAVRSETKYLLDKDAPSVTMSPNKTEGYVGKVEVTLEATDALSGVKSISYAWSVDNTSSPQEWTSYETKITKEATYETAYLWVKVIDHAGNETTEVSEAFTFDTTLPEITITFHPETTVKETEVTTNITAQYDKTITNKYYYWSTNANLKSEEIEWNELPNTTFTYGTDLNGTYYLYIKAVDNHGLINMVRSDAITFDNASPEVSIEKESSTEAVKEITTKVEVSDSHAFTVYYNWSTNEVITDADYVLWDSYSENNTLSYTQENVEGTYYLHIKAVDALGNESEVVRSYVIDTVAPSAPEISLSTEEWTNENITVTISGSDTLEYKINDGEWLSYQEAFIVEENAIVKARNTDFAGNISEESTKEITNIDKTVDTITVNPQTTNVTNTDYELELQLSSSNSPMKQMKWALGNHTILEMRDLGSLIVDSKFVVSENGIYTLYVQDEAGNENVITYEVSNFDKEAPKISLNGEQEVTVEVNGKYEEAGVTITDNRDESLEAIISGIVDTSTVGEYTLTYSAKDSAGNESLTVSRTIRVVDTTKPIITIVGEEEITIDVRETYDDEGATVSDNYDKDISVQVDSNVNSNVIGDYRVIYRATDSSLNEAEQKERIVHVRDRKAPTLTLYGESVVFIPVGETYTELGVKVVDNYDSDLEYTVSGTVDKNTVGTYYLVYKATDKSGNVSDEVTRTVQVIDNKAPVITIIGEDEISINVFDLYTDDGATVTDNYDETVTLLVQSNVNVNKIGTYEVVYSATDASGNEAIRVKRIVHVVDKEAPEIQIVGKSPMYIEVGSTYTDAGAIVKDNYDADRMIYSDDIVLTNIIGEYEVRYQAMDASGNRAAIVTRKVYVVDSMAPAIVLNGEKEVSIKVGSEYIDAGASAYDVHDGDLTSHIIVNNPVNTNVVGNYTITYNVSDSNHNAATEVSRIVHVIDDEAPVIKMNGEANITIPVGSIYTDAGASVTDNYDKDLQVTTINSVNTLKVGDYEVRYQVSDSSSNAATEVIRSVHVVATSLDETLREKNNCELTGECYSENKTESNYVWYSGYLWRIVKVNEDNSLKLITEDTVSALSFNEESNSSFNQSIMKDWLNKMFLPNLNNATAIINQNANWCIDSATNSLSSRSTCTNYLSNGVGLLTLDEYNRLGGKDSFLNTRDVFYTLTSKENKLWVVTDSGEAYALSTHAAYGVRPVINVFASEKIISGNGSKANPYRFENDKEAISGSYLKNRYSGEYVTFAGKTWRIVSTDNNSTRLVLDSYAMANNEVLKSDYKQDDFMQDYLNTTVYQTLFEGYENDVKLLNTVWYESNYELGTNPFTNSLVYSDTFKKGYVGLLRVGELMAGHSHTMNNYGLSYWTITKNNDKAWYISTGGMTYTDELSVTRAIRPVIELNGIVQVQGGNGTYQSPYTLS